MFVTLLFFFLYKNKVQVYIFRILILISFFFLIQVKKKKKEHVSAFKEPESEEPSSEASLTATEADLSSEKNPEEKVDILQEETKEASPSCGEQLTSKLLDRPLPKTPLPASPPPPLPEESAIVKLDEPSVEQVSTKVDENVSETQVEEELGPEDVILADPVSESLTPALEQPDGTEECVAHLLDTDLNGTSMPPLVNEDEAIKVGSPDNLNELAARTLIANTHDGTNSEEQSHLAMVDESVISNTLLRPRWHHSLNGAQEVRTGLSCLPDTYGRGYGTGVRNNLPPDFIVGMVDQGMTDLNLGEDELSPEIPVFAEAASMVDGKMQLPQYYPTHHLQDHHVSTPSFAVQVNESELREIDLNGYISMAGAHRTVPVAEEARPSEWEPTYATPSVVTGKKVSPCIRSGNTAWQVNTARNVQPLSSAQLRSLYYNNELAVNTEYIESFVQVNTCNSFLLLLLLFHNFYFL